MARFTVCSRAPIAVGLLVLGALVMGLRVVGEASTVVTWDRPVTIYIGFPPGGTFDIVVRALQPALEKELKVPVLPTNVVGAGGAAAALRLLSDPADGYQMLIISRSYSAMPYLGQPQVDPVTRFTPIAVVAEDVPSVNVHAGSPYRSVEEFLDAARRRPAEITVGVSGRGGVWHMAGVLLEKATSVRFTFVPHAGGAEAAGALAAGVVQATIQSPAEVRPFVEAGRVRLLAVMADKRHPLFPNVPTLRERGINVTYSVWRGFVVKAGTPEQRVRDLRYRIWRAVQAEEFRKAMATAGVLVKFVGGNEFAYLLREEDRLVSRTLEELGLKVSQPSR
jgi:tripartite-type tricarboxylate transporter receptor subunit TctC